LSSNRLSLPATLFSRKRNQAAAQFGKVECFAAVKAGLIACEREPASSEKQRGQWAANVFRKQVEEVLKETDLKWEDNGTPATWTVADAGKRSGESIIRKYKSIVQDAVNKFSPLHKRLTSATKLPSGWQTEDLKQLIQINIWKEEVATKEAKKKAQTDVSHATDVVHEAEGAASVDTGADFTVETCVEVDEFANIPGNWKEPVSLYLWFIYGPMGKNEALFSAAPTAKSNGGSSRSTQRKQKATRKEQHDFEASEETEAARKKARRIAETDHQYAEDVAAALFRARVQEYTLARGQIVDMMSLFKEDDPERKEWTEKLKTFLTTVAPPKLAEFRPKPLNAGGEPGSGGGGATGSATPPTASSEQHSGYRPGL
jgi:hypothetical protein